MASCRCLFFSALIFIVFAVISNILIDYCIIYWENQREETVHPDVSDDDPEISFSELRDKEVYLDAETQTDYPIVIWWTPFTGYTRIVHHCSKGSCLFTHSRTEYNNSMTVGFMFYGSMINWGNLPLPRKPEHYWMLLHEESPKNNWPLAYNEGISLFNITSTPSRYSSYPLVTQYLESLEKLMRPLKYSTSQKSKGDKGLVMYLHSDCDPPSDRDSYVSELMKYIKVDSYGKCLHNKDLPEHLRDPISGMDSEDLLDIISQYKFTLAMENAICDDYITEKLWRPLYAGSVPVVKGSPSVIDWAPDNHSIIVIDDYPNPKELANYLQYLDTNDIEYDKYLSFKENGITNPKLLNIMNNREWSVNVRTPNNIDHIGGFECYICNLVTQKKKERMKGLPVQPLIANTDHYKCQYPKPLVKRKKSAFWWKDMLMAWRQIASREKQIVESIAAVIRNGGDQDEVNKAYNVAAQKYKSDDIRLDASDYIQ
jgi:hypothetical protein